MAASSIISPRSTPRHFADAHSAARRRLGSVPPKSVCLTLIFLAGAFLAACDAPVAPPLAGNGQPPSSAAPNSLKARQAEFLNRIRDADPSHRTIDRAMLNEQNELGLILDRTVEMDKVPELMRTIVIQMAREFPQQDLTVLAYTPSNPPHKVGTAHLDAKSRGITYDPAQ